MYRKGYISDIKKMSEIIHNYGARLLVDEAHGAHFYLISQLMQNQFQHTKSHLMYVK